MKWTSSWAADPGSLGSFDNIPFETGSSGQEFLAFFALNAPGIQRRHRMFHKDLPVTFADAESFMGEFHIASAVDDWPPKRLTQKVDHQLTISFHAIFAVALPIDTDLRIARQPPEQIIRGGRDGIIAAETRIERLFCCLRHRLPPYVGAEHFFGLP